MGPHCVSNAAVSGSGVSFARSLYGFVGRVQLWGTQTPKSCCLVEGNVGEEQARGTQYTCNTSGIKKEGEEESFVTGGEILPVRISRLSE